MVAAALLAGLLGPGADALEEGPVTGPGTLVPMGRAVGIKLFSDGVMVVGFSQIPADRGAVIPARDCGLREGDVITHINAREVDTIEEVRSCLREIGGAEMSIRALRGGKPFQVTAQAARCSSDGAYKLGAWLRDSMAGIGTVTWYDPDSGRFGALGHGINDVDTARLMPMDHGGVLTAHVDQVKKGQKGDPGELHGSFETQRDIGVLSANTGVGIFGTLDAPGPEGAAAVPVARREELHTGPATILSNVSGDEVEEFTVEITRLLPGGETGRDMTLRVTDPRLLERTGGIVQGMSGSPILQDGKLVGAVTHVLISDPAQGYGVFIQRMLQAAGES